jgi:hypothetical protein
MVIIGASPGVRRSIRLFPPPQVEDLVDGGSWAQAR